jgi:peptidoglycan/LPS O-acetylase OafA/YrhL
MTTGTKNTGRRYDLDWLRVLAFGLLILYHVGMYYVADWGWHIKSPAPSEFLQNFMYLTNPWRMSLLFFVSGAALFFACRKIGRWQLVSLRNRRLLLPLFFGMAVIVPPQLYVELLSKEGMQAGYLQFYSLYLDVGTDAYQEHQHSPLGLWTWNHLWFLAYLWVYTLLFVPLKPWLDRAAVRLRQAPLGVMTVLLVPALLLTGLRLTLAEAYPPTNALFDDWYNHARYVSFLFAGYVLADCARFWHIASRWRWRWLAGALFAYAVLLLIAGNGLEPVLGLLPEAAQTPLVRLLVSFDQWLWVLAVLGLGHHFLNRPSAVLRYMNDAILPWYMLHQTLIVLLAFWLAPIALPQGLEAVLLIGGTVVGCAFGYQIVKRSRLGRLLFGLKTAGREESSPSRISERRECFARARAAG